MLVTDLFDRVDESEELDGVGVSHTDVGPLLIIKHVRSGMITQVPLYTLLDVEWDELRPILIGEREPEALAHMTRVVGYFSRVDNWNKSKIGELHDRHSGDYAVTDNSEK